MRIRRAKESDMEGIEKLLLQVCMVHHAGRPDLFKEGAKKYTREQLTEIIHDEERPVFAAVDENDELLGYAFCIFQKHDDSKAFTDIKTLYIDDLCVGESVRGEHIGKALYESCGLKPQKIGMEVIL